MAWLSTVGMAIASIGLFFVAFLPEQPSHVDLVWRLGLCGTGFGLFFSPNARHAVVAAPAKRAAAAGSIYTTMRMLALTVCATLVAALLAAGLGEGRVPGIIAMCLAVVAGAISAARLRRDRRAAAM